MTVKTFLIPLGIILILLAIALAVFIFTFDANRYKGVLIAKLEQAINKDVKIDNISLNILQGLAIKAQGISIKDKNSSWKDAMLNAASLDISLKILPLLKKDIQVQNISIEGLRLDISSDSLKMPELESGGSGASAGAQALGALKFLAQNIYILDSSIHYVDERAGKSIDFTIDIISARLRNISLYGPAKIEAHLGVFGRGKENITLKTAIYPELETKSPYLKDLELTINLDNLNLQAAMKELGLAEIPQLHGREVLGRLVITSDKLNLNPKRTYDSKISIDLSGPRIDFLPIKKPVQDINLKLEFARGDLDIQKLTARIGSGSFAITGRIRDLLVSQDSNLDIKIKNIEIGDISPELPAGSPGFKGMLNIDMQGSAKGLAKDAILITMKAKGKANLGNSVLENMNVLKVALDKLSMLPGLVQRLKDNLPEKYSELLERNNTEFKPLNADLEIKEGRIYFDKLLVESDAFYLTSKGSIGMNQDLQVSANLFIPQDLSDAFINVVPELKFLADAKGIITMPIDIRGRVPNISVMPNLDYVIQRLAVSKGQEIIDRIFKKQGGSESQAQEEGQDSSEQEPVKAIIKGVLDIFTKPRDSETK